MVPTQTEFGLALNEPYKVIHSVLKKRDGRPQPQSEATDQDIVAHYRSLFSGQDRTSKVPAITPDSLQTLLSAAESSDQTEAKLVRWRCMIQDTGFASEVYQSYQLQEHDPQAAGPSSAAGSDTAVYSAFGLDFAVDIASSSSDTELTDSTQIGTNASGNQSKTRSSSRRQADSLRERNVMYAVSVPGETPWARSAYGDNASWPGSDGAYLSNSIERSLSLSSPNAAKDQSAKNPLSNKSPIPEESHVAGLLKFYDVEGASASLQVTQVIEAVGILESAPFRVDDWQDLGFASPSAGNSDSAASSIYHGPCLHVLFFNPLPPSTIPQALTEARTPSLTGMASAPEIRAGLLSYLTAALNGDELAAEFLLITLLARVHTRQNGSGANGSGASDVGGTAVGGLSLNLLNVPEGADSKTGKESIPVPPLPKLQDALRNLLPAVVNQSLSLKHLNDAEITFSPRVAADESLQAGRLQLPKGTTLVVDEVGMGDGGTLREGGVKNVQSLAGVLKNSKLEYHYPYHSFSFEADLRVIVLSSGKSFLPVDIHMPLELGANKGTGKTELPNVTPDTWRLYRLFLLQARHASFTIDEKDGVAERISADFVAARKKRASSSSPPEKAGETAEGEGMATQEDLLRRMNIARLLALSKSEAKLSIDTWIRAGELDEARLERLRKLPLGRPAQNPVPL